MPAKQQRAMFVAVTLLLICRGALAHPQMVEMIGSSISVGLQITGAFVLGFPYRQSVEDRAAYAKTTCRSDPQASIEPYTCAQIVDESGLDKCALCDESAVSCDQKLAALSAGPCCLHFGVDVDGRDRSRCCHESSVTDADECGTDYYCTRKERCSYDDDGNKKCEVYYDSCANTCTVCTDRRTQVLASVNVGTCFRLRINVTVTPVHTGLPPYNINSGSHADDQMLIAAGAAAYMCPIQKDCSVLDRAQQCRVDWIEENVRPDPYECFVKAVSDTAQDCPSLRNSRPEVNNGALVAGVTLIVLGTLGCCCVIAMHCSRLEPEDWFLCGRCCFGLQRRLRNRAVDAPPSILSGRNAAVAPTLHPLPVVVSMSTTAPSSTETKQFVSV